MDVTGDVVEQEELLQYRSCRLLAQYRVVGCAIGYGWFVA
jgi:hypothetical protein